jgi:hypothetical protein
MSRVSVSLARMCGASHVEWRLLIRKASNKAVGPAKRNPKGNAFAGALLRRSSLGWNNHTALLASCIPSR